MDIAGRFFRPPEGSYFLFGPRGTGKSTWLHQHYPEAIYIDLLHPETFRTYVAMPERLLAMVNANKQARNFIIDEIQKIPELLDAVHKLMEDNRQRNLQFILTGSSATKLKRAGVNLLGGRLPWKTMHPFMAAELGNLFNLPQSLQQGLLPLVLDAREPDKILNAYITVYLKEEVQTEGLVRNIGNFSRFLEIMSFSHGAIHSTAETSRECQAGRKAVAGYLHILEDLLLGFLVPVFTKRAKRKLVHHRKFYYMDTGVFRSLRPRGPLDIPEEIGGAALEGLVAQHLRGWISYRQDTHQLYYWRTKDGAEVDFVVYGDKEFTAIEVKSSRTVSSKDVRSLQSFIADYPQARACLVYAGPERLELNGITCLPCEEFLLKMRPDESLPG